jgi:hypothetical protein
MKILVCISKTPDTTAKIAFTDNNTKFDTNGVQWIINPYDEWYSLVRAIELKEADASTVIHLITVATADADPIIRKALSTWRRRSHSCRMLIVTIVFIALRRSRKVAKTRRVQSDLTDKKR